MLTAFARAFRTPDLRKKLLFTLAIMVVYRLGAHVPVPGIDYSVVNACIKSTKGNNSLFGLVNMFSGGALLQLTIFALGIMPYITASIILQLLTVVIPRLEALKKEGQAGDHQDHAVHPLPDRRARGAPGYGPGGHRPFRQPVLAVPAGRRHRPEPVDLHHGHDGHDDDHAAPW